MPRTRSASEQNYEQSLQVAGLLENKDVRVATAAASVLIHAATPMLQHHPPKKDDEEEEEEEDLATKLKPLLLQLVSCGTPKAAKVAIRCCLLCFATCAVPVQYLESTGGIVIFSSSCCCN